MADPCLSLQVLGGRQLGGADQFYLRLVRALHEAGQPVIAVNRARSPVARELARTAVEQIHLPFANQWDFWSALRLRQLVRAHQPCVVQTYMGRATRLTRLSPNGHAVHIARLGGYYKIDGYYRHAHAWIGNTRGLCDYLVQQGLPAHRVYHIGNFVPDPVAVSEARREELRALHRIPREAWVLFALGRLIGSKGFDDLLEALSLLPTELGGRPMVLLIAGDGPLAAPLRRQAAALGVVGRIRWLGWQNAPGEWYALADAFVCPSRHETLGNVILEAWSYALPVVSTETRGALELIVPGETGLLSPCADPAALAERLRELFTSSEAARAELGRRGYRFLTERFSREAILAAYLNLYEQLLAERMRA
ncbi:glycosyltransferase [Candidatus Methylocalor cossyra]|uniref:Glycosyltransferase involved in cell wall biosynthesis n=1 Tax=Candidatus Methylocalor cossyra TaxID=3108543 RepID=A0ABM9NLI1_9GAMM